MYSSTYQKDVADMLFELGANFYIKKPGQFKDIKNLLKERCAL